MMKMIVTKSTRMKVNKMTARRVILGGRNIHSTRSWSYPTFWGYKLNSPHHTFYSLFGTWKRWMAKSLHVKTASTSPTEWTNLNTEGKKIHLLHYLPKTNSEKKIKRSCKGDIFDEKRDPTVNIHLVIKTIITQPSEQKKKPFSGNWQEQKRYHRFQKLYNEFDNQRTSFIQTLSRTIPWSFLVRYFTYTNT